MNCPLCERWSKTPFKNRHTTPTTAQESEACMVLGFWIASRKPEDVAFRLCEQHATQLFQLDAIEAARTAQLADTQSELAQGDQVRRQEFERRALEVSQHLATPKGSTLGPGLGGQLLGLQTAPVPQPPAAIPEGQADTRPRFNCPLCGKVVISGDVHAC